ncbi:MAG TPA: AbrB/MazE/SpoVT family DNA-binding domain-containing protein [Candidatus Binatia bacterium]|nr:AbrB/MazE/SpoVT family DNA-binding domain-containing protein [Candidatus Binatia bacterium]
MQTRISTKGQVVLPVPIRRKLDLREGDPLEAEIDSGRIVLTPRNRRRYRAKIVIDPITGLPVLSAGPDAPKLTSKDVDEILVDFP